MGSLLALARAQGKVGRVDSAIEATLALQLREARAPAWERNYAQAIPGRKLEIDFAWPRLKWAIESGQALVWALRLIRRRADELGLPLNP